MISIAIPAHNEEKSIQRTLTAITKSNFKKNKYEIVVCLSACSDDTKGEIRKFVNKNKMKIKTTESKRKGKVLAIKKLDRYIKNDIIVFVDADCSPLEDSIYLLYSKLVNSKPDILAISGNTVDPRYTDKSQAPKNFTEVFNRVFWQKSGRKIINGPLYSIRKGIVQKIPDDVISEDTYLSLIIWDKFINEPKAKVIQGSSQTVREYIRYQRNFQAAYRQIENYLKDIPGFKEKFNELSSQFDILLSDKEKYYPNISCVQLILVKLVILIGKVWGRFIKPTWDQTKGSKEIAG